MDGCNHIIHMFPSTPETKTFSFPTVIKQKIYQNLIKPETQLSLFIFIKQTKDLQRETQRWRGQTLRGNETGETLVSTAGGVKITGFNGLERPHIRTQLSEKVGIWGIWEENWRRAVSFFSPGTVPGRSENSQDAALGQESQSRMNWMQSFLFRLHITPQASSIKAPQVCQYCKTWHSPDFFCHLDHSD